MVLNEVPSERIQQTWYSRLAQERRELSVSVEDALNTPLEESFWLNDQSQYATVVGTGKSNHVFPPRLSLQSRSLPGTSSRVGTGLVNRQSDTAQHTNMWTRFVQRLKSSLSTCRFHSSVVATPALPPHDSVSIPSAQVEEVICSGSKTGDSGNINMLSARTREVSGKSECRVATGTSVRYGESRSTQGRQRLAGRTTRIRLEVVPSPSSEAIPNKEKHYPEPKSISCSPCEGLLSHTRVSANTRAPVASGFHSDTTSASVTLPDIAAFDNKNSASVCLPAVEKVTRRPVEDRAFVGGDRETTGIRLPAVEKVTRRPVEDRTFVGGDRGTTGIRLPAVEKVTRRPVEDRTFVDGDGGTTSIRVPAVEKVVVRGKESSPVWHAGTGKFECGQRDVTISDPSVRASSVVLVTLTANPGPVVVQYTSLQPGTGFTVHLTAPTAIGVPFNYVVLAAS